MNVDFTPEQQPVVQQAIERGRIGRAEDAAQEAFLLWVERERTSLPSEFGKRDYDRSKAQAAATRMLERRERRTLPEGVTICGMITEGRD